MNQRKVDKDQVDILLQLDQDDGHSYGQKLSDSFHRSDVFIPFDSDHAMESELRRFIDLIFGYPYHTPRIDEHMMFQAYAASLRSADLSRQVGAVIATPQGDILSSGANDVPKFGGGQYWSDDTFKGCDHRDFIKKYDSNKLQKEKIVEDVVKSIRTSEEVKVHLKNSLNEKFVDILKKVISKTEIKSITEYGRAVHAEMAALMTSARLGISTKECHLYTTTFPCHNCAKHIVASGIKKVIFVEPYPKSLAFVLHGDAISLNNKESSPKSISFEQFIGIGPRRFFDLFSMTLSNGSEIIRKDSKGEAIDFEKKKSITLPRITMSMSSIMDQEELLAEGINIFFKGDENDKTSRKRVKKSSTAKRKTQSKATEGGKATKRRVAKKTRS